LPVFGQFREAEEPALICPAFNRIPLSGVFDQRLGADFTAAICRAIFSGAKNKRNTCPKINSSASSATASEKINPPTTAMNVIAICMMTSFKARGY
jgi:hypothetical protein